MSEAKTVVILVLGLSFMVLFVGSVAGTDIPAWRSFSDLMSEGPDFPTSVVQPPVAQSLSRSSIPIGPGLTNTPVPVFGCASQSSFECVRSDDENVSYITLTRSSFIVYFTVDRFPIENEIAQIDVLISCRSVSIERSVVVYVGGGGIDNSFSLLCKKSSLFSYDSKAIRNQWNGFLSSNEITITRNEGPVFGPNSDVDISYVQVNSYTTGVPSCGNFDVGCHTGRFFSGIFSAVSTFVGGIVYVVQFVSAVSIYIIKVFVAFFVGVFGVFAWFTSMDAPTEIKAIIAILFLGLFAYLFYVFATFIVGMIGGAVNKA